MADAENSLPSSKKRAAGRELSRDNPGLDDEEDVSEQETGTFKRASDEVLASRRIVKVRRHQTSSAPSAPSSNPFAAIRLIPPTGSSVTAAAVTTVEECGKTVSEELEPRNDVTEDSEKVKDDSDKQAESKADEEGTESTGNEKNEVVNGATNPEPANVEATGGEKTIKEGLENKGAENEDKKDNRDENVEKSTEAASVSSFQQLSSSQNAFTGLVGTGFSNSTFSFGSLSKSDQSSFPSLGFGLSNNGSSSLFGNPGASSVEKSEGSKIPSMQEVPLETGEENEKAVFTADSVLFEFLGGGWKERGKGELKVNVSTSGTGKARLVMRARGNYRLILNASLFPDMKLANMEKRGITFACVNSNGELKDGLSTFALKFKDAYIVEEFRAVVTEHKGSTAAAASLKTPENSPKASDE